MSAVIVAGARGMPDARPKAGLAALTLTALGVVYGDLGTSPLYTLKTVLDLSGSTSPDSVLGLISLLVWTLIIITSVKYVAIAMRVDNDGEGGILALMSLLGIQREQRMTIVVLGLFGAALIYGDGIITPAISVLSALEGLSIATTSLTPFVLPMAVVVLALLFVVQPLGTAAIGRLFGPVMTLWFIVIGLLGLRGVALHPGVLLALNPYYGVTFLVHGGFAGFLVLGGVFLCVTGAEALYADMGHVGARPIRLAWYGLVLPALLLNYSGQGGMLLAGVATDKGNIFYLLAPPAMLIPLVVLSTLATIIASQSIITGAFSMTRQAIQLGWCPRLLITQTSASGYGQIYVGVVNWLMMVLTIALALAFRKSDNLAAAYGIAVSLTMLLTTCLLFVAMREIWRWSLPAAGALAGFFAVIDGGFVAANSMKILEGGWVPLVLASAVFFLMATWHSGVRRMAAAATARAVPVQEFLRMARVANTPRVPGTAVFLTRTTADTPPMMVWHLRNNRALHTWLVALTLRVMPIPWVDPAERVKVTSVGENFWRLEAHYGFMEQPDIPAVLAAAAERGCTLPLGDVTYFIAHEVAQHRSDGQGMARWREAIFAFMLRNSAHAPGFFGLPDDGVVELGRQVAI
jgi:KUP system potassium uptake protein